MLARTTCARLNCYGDYSCCNQNQPGEAYCQIQSFCKRDPLWEVIVIPAALGLFALLVIGIIVYKLCTKSKQPMSVHNFARQEIGSQKLLSYPSATRLIPTNTSIIENNNLS